MFGPWEERGVTISLPVIAKNEVRTLGRCLESVRTVANPELAAIAEEDAERFRAKWG